MAKVIVMANQKGGVAKTTTTSNIADALTFFGNRVLMVDADPQCNLTNDSGYDSRELSQKKKSLAHCFSENTLIADAVVGSNPSIIAGSDLLRAVDDQLDMNFTILHQQLENIKHDYDFILIDTAPGISKVTRNALGAADYVIVPVKTEKRSLDGIDGLLDTINKLSDSVNPRLEIAGFLPTIFDRTKSEDNLTLSDLKERYSKIAPIFDPIPLTTFYNKAARAMKSVFTMRKVALGKTEYENLAKYLMRLS